MKAIKDIEDIRNSTDDVRVYQNEDGSVTSVEGRDRNIYTEAEDAHKHGEGVHIPAHSHGEHGAKEHTH